MNGFVFTLLFICLTGGLLSFIGFTIYFITCLSDKYHDKVVGFIYRYMNVRSTYAKQEKNNNKR